MISTVWQCWKELVWVVAYNSYDILNIHVWQRVCILYSHPLFLSTLNETGNFRFNSHFHPVDSQRPEKPRSLTNMSFSRIQFWISDILHICFEQMGENRSIVILSLCQVKNVAKCDNPHYLNQSPSLLKTIYPSVELKVVNCEYKCKTIQHHNSFRIVKWTKRSLC